jgi:hypothetical protein
MLFLFCWTYARKQKKLNQFPYNLIKIPLINSNYRQILCVHIPYKLSVERDIRYTEDSLCCLNPQFTSELLPHVSKRLIISNVLFFPLVSFQALPCPYWGHSRKFPGLTNSIYSMSSYAFFLQHIFLYCTPVIQTVCSQNIGSDNLR